MMSNIIHFHYDKLKNILSMLYCFCRLDNGLNAKCGDINNCYCYYDMEVNTNNN